MLKNSFLLYHYGVWSVDKKKSNIKQHKCLTYVSNITKCETIKGYEYFLKALYIFKENMLRLYIKYIYI